MNNKKRIESFMKEYEELCVKHGLSLSHEDCEGGFIIDEYNQENIEWVKAAMNGFEMREQKEKEIIEIKERLKNEEAELEKLLGNKDYSVDKDGNVVDSDNNIIRKANLTEEQLQSNIRMFNMALTMRIYSEY